MRDLPLNAMRAFALVYAHGGVRAAARELGVAHSAVSRHLAELSRWLGVPVVRTGRGRRGFSLTPQGEALGKAALAGLRGIEQMAVSLREAKSVRSVSLSTVPSFAVRWLLPRIPGFEAEHPRIELSVLVDQQFVDFQESAVDLAIRMGSGGWPGLRAEPLMNESLYPVMSPAFWKSSRRPRRPEDLVRLRLLHDRDPHATWEMWRRERGPKSLDARKGPRFASSDLVLRAAMQGQGVALARHRLAVDDINSGALLKPIDAEPLDLGPTYWLVLPQRQYVRPAVATVIEWLKKEARVSSGT